MVQALQCLYLFHLSNKITGFLLHKESSITVDEYEIHANEFLIKSSILLFEKERFLNFISKSFFKSETIGWSFTIKLNLLFLKNSSKDLMNDIVNLAKNNTGDHLFIVHIPSDNEGERKIVSKKMKVSNNNQFLILLRDLLGESNVWID